jgi:hypothetical protein
MSATYQKLDPALAGRPSSKDLGTCGVEMSRNCRRPVARKAHSSWQHSFCAAVRPRPNVVVDLGPCVLPKVIAVLLPKVVDILLPTVIDILLPKVIDVLLLKVTAVPALTVIAVLMLKMIAVPVLKEIACPLPKVIAESSSLQAGTVDTLPDPVSRQAQPARPRESSLQSVHLANGCTHKCAVANHRRF